MLEMAWEVKNLMLYYNLNNNFYTVLYIFFQAPTSTSHGSSKPVGLCSAKGTYFDIKPQPQVINWSYTYSTVQMAAIKMIITIKSSMANICLIQGHKNYCQESTESSIHGTSTYTSENNDTGVPYVYV